jgi:hypothetical protein
MALLEMKSRAVLKIRSLKAEYNLKSGSERDAARVEFHRDLYGACAAFISQMVRFEHSVNNGFVLECIISTIDESTIPAMKLIGEKFGESWALEEFLPSKIVARGFKKRELSYEL